MTLAFPRHPDRAPQGGKIHADSVLLALFSEGIDRALDLGALHRVLAFLLGDRLVLSGIPRELGVGVGEAFLLRRLVAEARRSIPDRAGLLLEHDDVSWCVTL